MKGRSGALWACSLLLWRDGSSAAAMLGGDKACGLSRFKRLTAPVLDAQISPDVMAEHAGAVDAAIAALRYGSINVNVSNIMGFCVPRLTWGAFPGNSVQACPATAA